MLPWCKDERDEIVHTDYIRFLAQMNAHQRSKAAKHAVTAASSLLRNSSATRQRIGAKHSNVDGKVEGRRVAWRDIEN